VPGSVATSRTLALLEHRPIVGVVRTYDRAEAAREARRLLDGGLTWVEITFTVPDAPGLLSELRSHSAVRAGTAALGLGTVTTPERAALARAVEADFVVTPNTSAEVARIVLGGDAALVLGALTPSEIVAARSLGAHLVKVYPLPPVGGPAYLRVVRQPLDDVPMLAAGGFPVAEIPAYRAAGASAFGLASTLLPDIPTALAVARGEEVR
jgi:2-dehydro-3-deoxyphosphogluconate aldolase/(4S)-4-hydroxy-2-oxoglutarate aldolase